MAFIQKVKRDFTPQVKEINYLNKTFTDFRQSLIDFAKVYYPNTYNDFNQSSPGMMFIEMASYVGDVLSYYIDNQFKENLILYTQETQNIIRIAQSLGLKPKPTTAATTMADIFQLVPSMGSGSNFQPDSRYFLKIDSNMVVQSSVFSNINFRSTNKIDFSDPLNREITVYAVDQNNAPLTYLVKKQVPLVAGTINTITFTFGAPQKFSTVTIPDLNTLGVISIVDSNGNVWNEVDYLAQDVVFADTVNSAPVANPNQSLPPNFILDVQTQPRRFITRYNDNFQLEIHFGSGVTNDFAESISLDNTKIASTEYQSRLGSTPLDPADFLNSTSYGLAPSNTTLTVTYAVGGGIQSNAPAATINNIVSMTVLNDISVFSATEQALFNSTKSTVAINNPDAATGGKDGDSVEEIRQNALAFFNAQNRLVSREDYMVRCYAMPPQYGAIAKVYVLQDDQINGIMYATNTGVSLNSSFVRDPVNSNAINLYVLGYDINKNLVTLNDQTKLNLKAYLDSYKMLTDQINILDAFVITIGVNFRIAVFKNYNLNDVLARSLDAVKSFFNIDKWQINQPIIINDLYLTLAQVDGVQSVLNMEIVNKYAFRDGPQYSQFFYDITSATDNGVIYPSLDPSIFQVLNPDIDLVGSAIQ